MMRLATLVIVTTPSGEVRHPWATSVAVSKRGVLKVYNGLAVRAFYPYGEWLQYTVAAPVITGPIGTTAEPVAS